MPMLLIYFVKICVQNFKMANDLNLPIVYISPRGLVKRFYEQKISGSETVMVCSYGRIATGIFLLHQMGVWDSI